MGVSNLTENRAKNAKSSVASNDLLECDCSIDFSNFDILAVDVSKFNLLVS